ncbi:MAG TPA: hypothetical protein VF796_29015 [Humisphaera sp.]
MTEFLSRRYKPVMDPAARGSFVMADLNAQGELQLKAEYRYDLLVQIPGAADLIGRASGLLWRHPDGFEEAVAVGDRTGFTLRWRPSSQTAGIATLRDGDALVSLTLLASGIDADGDAVTLRAFQSHLLRELHDTGVEPAFGLTDLADRPLAATFNFHTPGDLPGRAVAALADRCFAASYFRFQGLC